MGKNKKEEKYYVVDVPTINYQQHIVKAKSKQEARILASNGVGVSIKSSECQHITLEDIDCWSCVDANPNQIEKYKLEI